MEVLRLLMAMIVICSTKTERGKRANHCSMENLDILHGSYDVKSGSSIIAYTCDDGYILYGAEKLYCIALDWTTAPPKCITNTCPDIPVQEPLRVQKEYNGSLLRFSCAVMNLLEGTELITCDGTIWSDKAPKCTPAAPSTSCDFEDPRLCGWVHHDDSDVEWRLQMGNTKTARTGPDHDHTYGPAGNGRYMFFETSSPTRTGHKAILLSPLYPRSYSRRCFDFWYHLLATGDVSTLEVFIKPESKKLGDLQAVFSVSENKGADWLNHTVLIQYISEPFQVVFVATRGKSFRSDIAIDDVLLYMCPEYFPTTSTIATTAETTIRNIISTIPVLSTKGETRVIITSTKTSSEEVKSASPLNPAETSINSVSSNVTLTVSTRITMTPLINPNVPVQSSSISAHVDSDSNLIYIVVGVGLVVAVTIVVGVGVYCCKRKHTNHTMQSNGAVNPLYSAMAGEEAAVHFANDVDTY